MDMDIGMDMPLLMMRVMKMKVTRMMTRPI